MTSNKNEEVDENISFQESNNSDSNDDQKRVMTPKEAKDLGADYLVIGRPITGAENIVEALEAIYQSIS